MIDSTLLAIIAITLALTVAIMAAVLYIGWWMQDRKRTLSLYTGIPLRRATELSFATWLNIGDFLTALGQYDNRMFNLKYASFCRETGRIFPNSITWFGEIKINWDFIQNRYPGQWISWGSLDPDLQEEIRIAHGSLEGFQTEESCSNPAPRYIEDRYIDLIPGPLYVDINSKIVLGWKRVPGTELEVLIVQKPLETLLP